MQILSKSQSDERGCVNQERAVCLIKSLDDIVPIFSVIATGRTLDNKGIDIVVRLFFNEKIYVVLFQVKSSEAGKREFEKRYPEYVGKVACLVVNEGRSNKIICIEIIDFIYYILSRDIQLQKFLSTIKGGKRATRVSKDTGKQTQRKMLIQKLNTEESKLDVQNFIQKMNAL